MAVEPNEDDDTELDALEGLPDLYRRFSRKIDQGKTIQLSVADLEILVECGVFEHLALAAARDQKRMIRERRAARTAGTIEPND